MNIEETERLISRLAETSGRDFLSKIVLEHFATGGKRLRVRLALSVYEALGGSGSAVPWAAACEILHNATLIHDDYQDGDRVRRGKPTVWAAHGGLQAINAGDFLFMLPFRAIDELEVSSDTKWRLAKLLSFATEDVIRGQSLEPSLQRLVSEGTSGAGGFEDLRRAYFECISKKTAALFRLPAEGAALLAGRCESETAEIGKVFGRLGRIFQLQDDVLDLYGEKGREERGSDIREGKITLLVIEHLAERPQDRDWLLKTLVTPREETRVEDVHLAIEKFRQSGALDKVLSEIKREADEILTAPILKKNPSLHPLVKDLFAKVIHPISHLI